MTTDNRTNEQLSGNAGQFTEAQVKAAQQAWLTYPHKRGDLSNAENAMCAALVAAQGAAPAPSSGVDEDNLAEVIDMHREVYLPKQGDSGCSCGWRRTLGDSEFSAHRARAVAAWLKGQGNAARE